MASGNSAPEWVHASVFRRPYSARERLCLHIQAKKDRRDIPPLWLWKLLLPDEPSGVAPDDVLWESPRIHRAYADPVPAHIYIDWTRNNKKFSGGGVFTEANIPIHISRAETRRLGREFQSRDDLEYLISDGEDEYLYIPRPGDIFRFADDHYAVQQWFPPKRYGPTTVVMTWNGVASLVEEDVTAPGFGIQQPPTPQPEIPPAPRYAWRG